MPIANWLKPLLGMGGGIAGGMAGGPIGSALGTAGMSALGGLGGGLLGNWLSGGSSRQQMPMRQSPRMGMGGGYTTQQVPGAGTLMQAGRFTPEQQLIYSMLGQQGMAGMGQLPTAEFGPIRKAAETQFHQQIIPGIKEQFTSAGAGGQRSSAFEQALGSAGAGLQERLAAMEQQFGMQQRGQEQNWLMNLFQMALQPQFETGMMPESPGMLGGLAGGAGQGLGMLLPLLMMQYFGGGGFGGAGTTGTPGTIGGVS